MQRQRKVLRFTANPALTIYVVLHRTHCKKIIICCDNRDSGIFFPLLEKDKHTGNSAP